MEISQQVRNHASVSLQRLLPRLESRFAADVDVDEWEGYRQRIRDHFPRLFEGLHHLYGGQYDFFTTSRTSLHRRPNSGSTDLLN